MVYTWSTFPPERLLSERFGMQHFHPGQREIIEHLVKGKRVLAIQRTGWGKSLCYQLASLYYPHLTLVFSPLKALMRDQCQRCNEVYRIPAAIVGSDFTRDENRATLELAKAGKLKIIYIAPEQLSNVLWQEYVPQLHISVVVVDEAHCISNWGHDFRPEYRRIRRLLNLLPANTPVLALTATANHRVEQDIMQQIGETALLIRGSMQRSNLHVSVTHMQGDKEKLSYLAENIPVWLGSGIVYTATKESTEKVATFLKQQGIEAEYYHASRSNSVRQEIEQGLMKNRYKVVCSTNALGMGIDKPDLQFVVHYQLPASPIHYYQEIGRAGRDGNPARCILLYNSADLDIQEYFIRGAKPAYECYGSILAAIQGEIRGLRANDLLSTIKFSRNDIEHALSDLEDQDLITYIADKNTYIARTNTYISKRLGSIDLSFYELVYAQKQQELLDMQHYAESDGCYMGYLTAYLGDTLGYRCGVCKNCQPENFVPATPLAVVKEAAQNFEQNFLPIIEKRDTIMEAGWSLSYHYHTSIGKLVSSSKYRNSGIFAEGLVLQAVKAIYTFYPLTDITGIVSVPPTKSGNLVENFALRIAHRLNIPYLPVLTKTRLTQEQKNFANSVQKQKNVQGAFSIQDAQLVAGKVLLLIDDIYDSGHTLYEVAATLRRAGSKAIYPFTITKTRHSDDQ